MLQETELVRGRPLSCSVHANTLPFVRSISAEAQIVGNIILMKYSQRSIVTKQGHSLSQQHPHSVYIVQCTCSEFVCHESFGLFH